MYRVICTAFQYTSKGLMLDVEYLQECSVLRDCHNARALEFRTKALSATV